MKSKIKYVAKLNSHTLDEDTSPDFRFRYIDISSVDSAGSITLPDSDITFASAPSRARRIAPIGSTVVSTVRTYLRAVAQVPATKNNVVYSTAFAVLEAMDPIDPDYLSYYCRSDLFIEEVVARSTGVSYPAISPSELGDLSIHTPPLLEQRRIANYLDSEMENIDRFAQLYRRLLQIAREKLTATVETLTLYGLDTQHRIAELSDGDKSPFPSKYPIGRLKDVARRVDVGIAEAATHAYAADGVPLIRSTNIRENRVRMDDALYLAPWFAERNKSKYVFAGDIVTVRTGNAGVSAVIPQNLHNSQTFTQLITTIRAGYSPAYFCYFLNSAPCRRYFDLTSWGSAQKNISVPILANAPVPVPPPREQQRIVNGIETAVETLEQLSIKAGQQIRLASERRQALITAAVTGQFDVSAASGRGVTE